MASSKIFIELTQKQIRQVVEQDKLNSQGEVFHSITMAAKLLTMDKSNLHRKINKGLIERVYVGKSPKIKQSEIDKYLKIKP